jgi:ATP-dependent exoDNAse (exonuclease V) beta subunit
LSPVVFGPAAEALFRLGEPTAVSAGAGSGKTTALVELVLRLLDGRATGTPCAPSELAAITFTERAAGELRERVRAAVAEKVRAAAAAGEVQDRAAWVERLRGLDRLVAGTIHAFCGRLLRERAPEVGLDPDFEVVDEAQASAWLSAASREAVVAALDEGRPAARALAAAPGAGTRGLAGWIAGLVRERASRGDEGPPALAEGDAGVASEARLRLLAGAQALEAARGLAASEGASALVEAVARARVGLRPEDLDGLPTMAGLGRLRALGAAARTKAGRGLPRALAEARDAMKEADETFQLAAADALAVPQRAELAALLMEAERRYAAQKRAARAVDFDDLLLLARGLLRGDAALRAELRGGLRALLVDEYQDVNPVQQSIFELLCQPGPVGDRGPILVAVGDLKQSIYRFRGADVAVFARLIRRFEGGEGRVLRLTENHRSAPAVLELVNEVSARALQPPAGEAPRDDELSFAPADRLQARRAEGARPACELLLDGAGGSAADRRLREARALSARIRQVVSGQAGIFVRELGEEGGPERLRIPRPGDLAVLFRRLTQLGPYERALREAGVPFRLARGGGFYQASEVRDVGELFASLADPGDALSWAALLRSPACMVSDGALLVLSRVGLTRLHRLTPEALDAELARAAGQVGVAGEALLPKDERARLLRFLSVWRKLSVLRDRLALPDLLARAVEDLDLDAALLASPDGERRAANLAKVLALAIRAGKALVTPAELAAHLRAMATRPPREPEADLEAGDAVALLSVHQAKGLEWPVVFVPDLGARGPSEARPLLLDGEGRLCTALFDPAREEFLKTGSLEAAREAERRARSAESRRLLYVALTRARDHLVLSGEAGKGESWRRHLEDALAEAPELARLLPIEEVLSAPVLAAPVPAGSALSPPSPPALPGEAPLVAVRLAVTELSEFARCPRRHLLGRVLGIPEPVGSATPPADDPSRATTRGTLAHAMLAEADLGAPPLERRAQLAAAATRRGYDPDGPGVRRILGEVLRFAESAAGRPLAEAARQGRLSREVPFLLRLKGGGPTAVYLVGALDALLRGPGGELTVVDFKYATPRPGSAERYRLQLCAYALAAQRAHPRARVRAVLQFLRGDQRRVDLTPSTEELRRFELSAPGWGVEAARAREVSPAELGREQPRCRAEGCGYVARCFPGERG